MKKTNKVLYIILISLFSLTVISCKGDEPFYSDPFADKTAPVIAEVIIVTTPSNDNTPSYTFSSDEAVTIAYGGSCSSSTTSAIDGDNTITLDSLSEGTYSDCTITVTDEAANVSTVLNVSSFTIDNKAPSVNSFTLSDTALKVGDNATVTLVFSETVYSFSSSADITVPNGTLATMTSSDNITWTRTFTPTANTEDVSNTLSLATSYTDTAGNEGSVATTANYEVDTLVPSVSSFTLSDTALKVGENATVSLVFSEAVASFSSSADITVANGTLATMTSTDNITWTGTLTPPVNTEDASNTLSLATSYTDTIGNPGPAATTANYEVDTLAPTVKSFTLSDTALKAGDNATVKLVFSEAVVSFSSSADITVANGTLTTMTSSDNITWSRIFTPTVDTEDASNTLSLATSYTDTAGNAGPTATTLNYEVDTLAPSVNSFTLSDTALKAGDNATVTLVFSETVASFSSSADITVDNGTLATMTSTDNITWTGTFTPTTNTEDANNTLSLATSYSDPASNDGLAATTANYEVETLAPTVSSIVISSATGIQNNFLNAGDNVSVTANFSESVIVDNASGTPTLTIVVGSTDRTLTYTSGDNSTALVFKYKIQAGDNDSDGISIGANVLTLNSGTIRDAAGNNATLTHSALSDNNSYKVDTTAPTVDSFTLTDTELKAGESATVTLVFSDAVISFSSAADITVANGTLATMTSSDNITWSATFTPTTNTEDASNTLALATSYSDPTGNAGPASTTANYEVDTLAPTVNSFTLSDTALKADDNATVTLVFSEAVASFSSSADITVASGTLATMTSTDNITWTGTFTPTADIEDAINTLSLATSYTDTAGNVGPAASTVNYEVETLVPTVSSIVISSATGIQNNVLNAGDVVSVTSTFSESVPVTGTPQLPLVIGGNNRTATYTSGSGSTMLVFKYTIQAEETDTDGISIGANTIALNSGTIKDAAGNNATLTHNAVSANSSYKVDTTAPTVSSVAMTSATGIQNNYLNAGDVASVTATFSENVPVTGTPQLTLVVGSTDRTATYHSGSGGTTLVFKYTIQAVETDDDGISIGANILVLNSGTIQDPAGNNATLTHSAVSANSSYKVDTTVPTLAETTSVPSLTNDNSTQYIFSSSEGGTISIGGSCSSDNSTAVADNMTVFFADLEDGTYSNCSITVADSAGNTQTITVNSFTIDTSAPTLSQVTAVTSPTNDNTSSYTFSSTEAGSITYGGSCSSSTTASTTDNNTINFNALADETYSNCKISVTDNASNTSNNLSVNTFTIDTVKPVLEQVTAVTTPTKDPTPGYAFSSDEAGTISYGGSSCSPGGTSAINGTNSISFGTLSEASYSCTITVTDSAENASSELSVNTFVIDTTAPTVSSISSSTSDGVYKSNDNITVTVSFNENVIVDNSSGNPRIQLETGTNDRYASYISGNSTNILSFLYTVQSGDNSSDLDYKSTDSLSANSGTIRDDATNDTTLTLFSPNQSGSLSANKAIVIDGIAPAVSSISPTNNQSGVSITDNISVTFSESMDSSSVTTNSSNTSCSGSFQLSSDNFISCLQMSSSPSSSNSEKTFTVDPSDNLSYSTTYLTRVTTGAKDSNGNTLSSQYESTNGFKTSVTFVIVGDSGLILSSSDNGATWDNMTSGVSTNLASVAYGGGTFVVGGNSGVILTSTNASTWISETSGGNSWSAVSDGVSDNLSGTAYGNDLHVISGVSGTILTSSDNGSSWTSQTSGTSEIIWDVTYYNNIFVSVSDNGLIYTSGDGTTWTSRTSGTSSPLRGVTYGNSTFVAVGNAGKIYTSPDGTTWTSRTSGTSNAFQQVVYGNSTFVAVGSSGTIYTSGDGTTWTSRTSGSSNALQQVAYGNNTFVVISNNGEIFTSADGTTWTLEWTSGTTSLNGITFTE